MQLNRIGAVAVWIWIIGGLILAIITFTAAYYNITQVSDQAVRQRIVDSYNGLNQDIELICGQAPGARTTRSMSLKDVRAIFASQTQGKPSPFAPRNVSHGNTSIGTNVCLTFVDTHYGCTSHACTVKMDFIGRPEPGSDMFVLGQGDGLFEFDLTINKTGSGDVWVAASHVP